MPTRTGDHHEVGHQPYPPSWVDGLQSRAASVRGGPWSAYLRLLLLAVALIAVASLLDGSMDRIGLLAIPVYGLLIDPTQWASAESAVVIGVVMVVAVIAFLLPLVGMNRRIRTERDDLRADAGARLRTAISELHDRVDAHDDPGVAHADRVVAALGREWEVLDRPPTWPWRSTTLGAFVSAMLVPVTIWLAQRLLERVV